MAHSVARRDLRPSQLIAIVRAERICSVLSLCGLCFIFVTFSTSRKYKKPINRLMFYAAFGDAIYSIGALIARSGVGDPESALCQAQGFLIEMFLLSDVLWCLAMSISVYLTVFKRFDAERLRRLEIPYGAVAYGVPFIVALTLCFVQSKENGKGHVYGNASLWCWITPKWEGLRIALLYGPAWVLIVAITIIYIVSGIRLFRVRQKLRSISDATPTRPQSQQSQPQRSQPGIGSKTTEIKHCYELPELSQASEGVSGDSDKDTKTQTLSYKPYEVFIGRGDDMREPSTLAKKYQHSGAQYDSSLEMTYTRNAGLFFLALVITWLPASINRVYTFVHHNQTSFPLMLMAAIVLPLMGFWNAVIYVVVSWDAVRCLPRDIVDFCTRVRRSRQEAGDPMTEPWLVSHPSTARTYGENSKEVVNLACSEVSSNKT